MTEKSIETTIKRRLDRASQRKSRGDKESARDLFEDACIMLAWECGELTEGQASKALGMDRVSARDAKIKLSEIGAKLGCYLYAAHKISQPKNQP